MLATQYCKVLALAGEPHILPTDEMTRVLKRFKSYGQRAQDERSRASRRGRSSS